MSSLDVLASGPFMHTTIMGLRLGWEGATPSTGPSGEKLEVRTINRAVGEIGGPKSRLILQFILLVSYIECFPADCEVS